MTEASNIKGLSYIPLIEAAYNALLKAKETELSCALKFGGLLIQAQEAVGKGGAWKPWLNLHCPQISHNTAIVYMRLARHKDVIEEISQHAVKMGADQDLSIRAAIKAVNDALGKTKTKSKPKPKAAGQSDNPEDDDAQALANLDVDAVLRGMGECWDAQQRKRLLSEQIKSTQPWDLALMVEDVWDPGKRKELIDELSRHKASDPLVVNRRKDGGQPAAQPTVH
jgi:hypothetical protein